MYKLFIGLMVVASVLVAQEKGNLGQVFNVPTQFYQSTSPTSSTAKDTTKFLPLRGAENITIFNTADDSLTAIVWYRLKMSTGLNYSVTTAWTLLDTAGVTGAGALTSATGGGSIVGQLSAATILGYDQIQFYVDYISGTADGAKDGSANVVKLLYYFLKNSAVVAK